jgi:hypothetical protein
MPWINRPGRRYGKSRGIQKSRHKPAGIQRVGLGKENIDTQKDTEWMKQGAIPFE